MTVYIACYCSLKKDQISISVAHHLVTASLHTTVQMRFWETSLLSALSVLILLIIHNINATLTPHREFPAIEHAKTSESFSSTDQSDATAPPIQSLVKRTNSDIVQIPQEYRQFALLHGWSVTVGAMAAVAPVVQDGIQNAQMVQAFERFYALIQANAAAKMLANAPLVRKINFETTRGWTMRFELHQRSTVRQLQWSFVYYFAQYMLEWVRNGYLAFGSLVFRHTSGIILRVSFVIDPLPNGRPQLPGS